MSRTTTNLLPANKVIAVTADALTTGNLTWQDTGLTEPDFGAGTVQRFGPFTEPRQFTLKHVTGRLVDTIESTIYESGKVGMQCNLTTIPAGSHLTIPPNSQVIIRDAFTLNGSLDLDGSLVLT
jgi:hypothetical protein